MLQGRKNSTDPCEDEECQCPEQIASLSLDAVVEDFLRRTRRILIVGTINEIVATHICSYLQVFSITKEPIYMYIHSPGGCVYSGYAIIDQMLSCGCPIYTIVRGMAHSMGAMIAAFGTRGFRYATPNSSLMLHSISMHEPPSSIEDHGKMFEHTKLDYSKKITDLARKMHISKKKLTTMMSETKWMQPKQAIKIGLIDGIWTPARERAVTRSFMR